MVEILGLPQVEPLRGGNSSGGNSNRKAFPKQTTLAAASKFANAPQLSLGHPAKNTQNPCEATHKVKRVQKSSPIICQFDVIDTELDNISTLLYYISLSLGLDDKYRNTEIQMTIPIHIMRIESADFGFDSTPLPSSLPSQ